MAMSGYGEFYETQWDDWNHKVQPFELEKKLECAESENVHIRAALNLAVNHIARLSKSSQIIRALTAGNPFVFDTEGVRQDVHEAAQAWLTRMSNNDTN